MSEPELHVHSAAYDTSDGPDYQGVLTITERCECGAPVHVYSDHIL